MSIVTGEGNWKRMLLRYTGPVNDAIYYYELFSKVNNVMPNASERKIVAEMNEREKKKYYERKEMLRQRREEQEGG